MSELQYTTVNRVIAKIYRDLKDIDLHETDAIEWIGEALEFLKVPQIQEQDVICLKVKNYEAIFPVGFQMVLQVARYNGEKPIGDCSTETTTSAETTTYEDWTSSPFYIQNFTPVRLANHVFFNTIVCKEKRPIPYEDNCYDEYTIVGTTEKKMRLSFKEGTIALAYIKNAIDKETGYPLIPDDVRYITAITYYLKWKIAQRYEWSGRQNYIRLAQDNERLWLKYARQAKNYMKMPKSLDEFQNLLDQTHYLIPRQGRYYGYFGKLGREEDRRFNDPNYRNNIITNYYET